MLLLLNFHCTFYVLPFPFHFQALEKEMAPHSSALAWRVPGTGESMGSQSQTRLKRLSSSSSGMICLDSDHRTSYFRHFTLLPRLCPEPGLSVPERRDVCPVQTQQGSSPPCQGPCSTNLNGGHLFRC